MEPPAKNHIGRKISRIRELKGMKQEALAFAMGVSQQTISNMENSESLDDHKLAEVAKVLEVSVEAIKGFSEEGVINYFNTFNDNSSNNGTIANSPNNCTFNPLDEMMRLVEENRKLYERLLESEREKIVYLEKMVK